MVSKKLVKTGKKIHETGIAAVTKAEETRRLWLACLGLASVMRKHGGEWIERASGETREFTLRTLRFARETLDDTKAHAGVFVPLVAKLEKQIDACTQAVENGMDRTLNRFGIPSWREIEDLNHRVAMLARKLKAAK